MALSSVSTSSLIGVAIACSGNVLISLALTVQKLAHRRQNEELVASRSGSSSENSSEETSPLHSPVLDATRPLTENRQDEPRAGDDGMPGLVVPVLMVPTAESGPDKAPATSDEGARAGRYEGQDLGIDGSTKRARSPTPSHIQISNFRTNITLSSPSATSQSAQSKSNPKPKHKQVHHDRDEENGLVEGKAEVEEGMYLKSKLWWLGMVLIAIGEGGNFLSYGFAPASVVAPLGTVALIANCVFAPLILRERFHAKELIGMAFAILGAVTVVWSSNASNPRLDPDGLKRAIIQIPFIIYTILNIIFATVLVLLSRSPRFGNKYIGIDVGVCALFGGYTVLSTKALSSLLSTMFLSAFGWWITWVLVAILVGTSILQVKYLNRALMRFQSKEVIPTQFVFFSLAAIIGSAVLYQEFRDVPFSHFVNFAFGIATTFLGVHLLTSFSAPEGEENGASSPGNNRPNTHRATSSASLNVLLPTTSRLSEHTPLLIPTTLTPDQLATAGSPSTAALLPKARLVKRTSTGDFTPTLGISSQAGFLLMATTPPPGMGGAALMKRNRSASRGGIGSVVESNEVDGGNDGGEGGRGSTSDERGPTRRGTIS